MGLVGIVGGSMIMIVTGMEILTVEDFLIMWIGPNELFLEIRHAVTELICMHA